MLARLSSGISEILKNGGSRVKAHDFFTSNINLEELAHGEAKFSDADKTALATLPSEWQDFLTSLIQLSSPTEIKEPEEIVKKLNHSKLNLEINFGNFANFLRMTIDNTKQPAYTRQLAKEILVRLAARNYRIAIYYLRRHLFEKKALSKTEETLLYKLTIANALDRSQKHGEHADLGTLFLFGIQGATKDPWEANYWLVVQNSFSSFNYEQCINIPNEIEEAEAAAINSKHGTSAVAYFSIAKAFSRNTPVRKDTAENILKYAALAWEQALKVSRPSGLDLMNQIINFLETSLKLEKSMTESYLKLPYKQIYDQKLKELYAPFHELEKQESLKTQQYKAELKHQTELTTLLKSDTAKEHLPKILNSGPLSPENIELTIPVLYSAIKESKEANLFDFFTKATLDHPSDCIDKTIQLSCRSAETLLQLIDELWPSSADAKQTEKRLIDATGKKNCYVNLCLAIHFIKTHDFDHARPYLQELVNPTYGKGNIQLAFMATRELRNIILYTNNHTLQLRASIIFDELLARDALLTNESFYKSFKTLLEKLTLAYKKDDKENITLLSCLLIMHPATTLGEKRNMASRLESIEKVSAMKCAKELDLKQLEIELALLKPSVAKPSSPRALGLFESKTSPSEKKEEKITQNTLKI